MSLALIIYYPEKNIIALYTTLSLFFISTSITRIKTSFFSHRIHIITRSHNLSEMESECEKIYIFLFL